MMHPLLDVGKAAWEQQGTGLVLLVRDNNQKGYVVNFVDFTVEGGHKSIYSQKIYKHMKFVDEGKRLFFTFQDFNQQTQESNLMGLSFAFENEASEFMRRAKRAVKHITGAKKKSPSAAPPMPNSPSSAVGVSSGMVTTSINIGGRGDSRGSTRGAKSTKRKGGLSKADISGPDTSSFKHVGHIGYDQNTGGLGGQAMSDDLSPDLKKMFEMPELQLVFKKAGVTQDQLKDPEIAKIVLGFVQKEQHQIKAQNSKAPPPPPNRSAGTRSGQPPSSGGSRAPPPPPPSHSLSGNRQQYGGGSRVTPPPPPGPRAPPPSRVKSGPPPPPTRNASMRPGPPPPPPTRGGGREPPPPPPPGQGRRTAAPPPPPPQRQVAPPPPPQVRRRRRCTRSLAHVSLSLCMCALEGGGMRSSQTHPCRYA